MIALEVFVGVGDLFENGFRVWGGVLRPGLILILSGAGNHRDGHNERYSRDIFHFHHEHIQISFKLSYSLSRVISRWTN
jgi:hypothetical protein